MRLTSLLRLGFIILYFVSVFLGCKHKSSQKKSDPNHFKIQSPSLPKFEPTNAKDLFAFPLDSAYKSDKKKVLERLYHDFWVANRVNGSIIIAKNGEILLEKYLGYANFERKDTLTKHSSLHIASVSKVLTAMVIMKLVSVDSLSINDDVRKFYPKFPYSNITVKNLLTHRSGLPNYAYFATDPVWDTTKTLTNKEMLNLMIEHKPEAYNQPDTHFSYSNTNYALLALIIEKVTKTKYATAMKRILFEPLKMNNTFVFSMEDSARVSQSYGFVKKKWNFNYLDAIYGDKNIYSTPRDLLKFDIAIYSNSFLPKALKDSIFKGYSYETRGIKNYGLGIRLLEWGTNEQLFYHNGWWHGNYSTFVHADKDTVSIIALGNKQNRSVYSPFNFVTIFGDYPLSLENSSEEKSEFDSLNIHSIETLKISTDSTNQKHRPKTDEKTPTVKKAIKPMKKDTVSKDTITTIMEDSLEINESKR